MGLRSFRNHRLLPSRRLLSGRRCSRSPCKSAGWVRQATPPSTRPIISTRSSLTFSQVSGSRAALRNSSARVGKKQRSPCSGDSCCHGGGSEHRDSRKGHRGANRQPLSAAGLAGGLPGIETAFIGDQSLGIALTKPCVYGCAGRLKISRTGPNSTR